MLKQEYSIHVTINKWKNQIIYFRIPDGDPDLSQNLMGSKFDQEPSSDFFSGRCNQ